MKKFYCLALLVFLILVFLRSQIVVNNYGSTQIAPGPISESSYRDGTLIIVTPFYSVELQTLEAAEEEREFYENMARQLNEEDGR